MKIIQISSASSSFSVKDYKKDIPRAWHSQIAYQLKKLYPKLEVESWTIERKNKKGGGFMNRGVKFRIFSTEIAIRHSMEISFSMLKALLKEQEKAWRENKKLIVHLHEHHTWQSYLMLFFLNKRKCKVVSQHHGARSPFQNLKKYKKLFLFLPGLVLMQFFEKILFKKINIIYGESIDEMSYLKESFPKSNFKFQTMGISDEYFEKISKKDARKKLGLSRDKKYLLFLGRITTKKGARELLDAMKNMHEKNIELLLIGGGQEREFYKNYAKEKKLENVNFLGSIYGEKKLLYLSACDCLILPSYTESAPVTIMEAMARNLPVIATTVGGIPVMIKDGREGILIRKKSSSDIVKGVNEILKWEKKDIRKYAERYRWGKIIRKTVGDYGGV